MQRWAEQAHERAARRNDEYEEEESPRYKRVPLVRRRSVATATSAAMDRSEVTSAVSSNSNERVSLPDGSPRSSPSLSSESDDFAADDLAAADYDAPPPHRTGASDLRGRGQLHYSVRDIAAAERAALLQQSPPRSKSLARRRSVLTNLPALSDLGRERPRPSGNRGNSAAAASVAGSNAQPTTVPRPPALIMSGAASSDAIPAVLIDSPDTDLIDTPASLHDMPMPRLTRPDAARVPARARPTLFRCRVCARVFRQHVNARMHFCWMAGGAAAHT